MYSDDMLRDSHSSDVSSADHDWTDDEERSASHVDYEKEDSEEYGGQSMTLRDILLQAGNTTQFDLLGLWFFLYLLFVLR
jgi:hypothetical protein